MLQSVKEGRSPSYKLFPLPLTKGKGIKRVPRKIEDFSGCLKGIGLINNLKARRVTEGGL